MSNEMGTSTRNNPSGQLSFVIFAGSQGLVPLIGLSLTGSHASFDFNTTIARFRDLPNDLCVNDGVLPVVDED